MMYEWFRKNKNDRRDDRHNDQQQVQEAIYKLPNAFFVVTRQVIRQKGHKRDAQRAGRDRIKEEVGNLKGCKKGIA